MANKIAHLIYMIGIPMGLAVFCKNYFEVYVTCLLTMFVMTWILRNNEIQ